MIEIIETKEHSGLTLADYAADAKFAPLVAGLRTEVELLRERINGRTVWMINSTAQGGGVAEMLPRLIGLMRELGIAMRWAVINTDRMEFFELTKRIHNLIHGDGRAGADFTAADAQLFEHVNRVNADALRPHLKTGDVLIVHDPQPLPLGQMLAKEAGVKALWRCHIGLDQRTDATRAAWRFLRPYLDCYGHAIFSLPEYIPSFMAGHASIIYPALDPLSHKNRELPVHKIVGILCNSGLQNAARTRGITGLRASGEAPDSGRRHRGARRDGPVVSPHGGPGFPLGSAQGVASADGRLYAAQTTFHRGQAGKDRSPFRQPDRACPPGPRWARSGLHRGRSRGGRLFEEIRERYRALSPRATTGRCRVAATDGVPQGKRADRQRAAAMCINCRAELHQRKGSV